MRNTRTRVVAAVALCGLASIATAQDAPAPTITAADLTAAAAATPGDIVVVDVRTPQEFAAGHVPGAINLPYDDTQRLIAALTPDKGKTLVLYCRSGRRSGLAIETLRAAGFSDLVQLEGNMPGWEAEGRPVER
jgi:rhodanese-related sulfurtransferase